MPGFYDWLLYVNDCRVYRSLFTGLTHRASCVRSVRLPQLWLCFSCFVGLQTRVLTCRPTIYRALLSIILSVCTRSGCRVCLGRESMPATLVVAYTAPGRPFFKYFFMMRFREPAPRRTGTTTFAAGCNTSIEPKMNFFDAKKICTMA